ncbi:hypothetical protein AB6A40_008931 [Gnathostoma spinigerum]|uniref:Uncharacterized protein n=1 Tax=Gnathostoma spinigerum TaxID=75299 RepID=A0ABD6EZT0_9BILA
MNATVSLLQTEYTESECETLPPSPQPQMLESEREWLSVRGLFYVNQFWPGHLIPIHIGRGFRATKPRATNSHKACAQATSLELCTCRCIRYFVVVDRGSGTTTFLPSTRGNTIFFVVFPNVPAVFFFLFTANVLQI